MRIEMMPLSSLLTMKHKKNPKEHDIDSLMDSFVRFGFVAPPTIDEATDVMVAGHGRCEALERMRSSGKPPPKRVEERGTEWYVPVIRDVEFENEVERDAYVIADNQNVMNGGWKFEVLGDLVQSIRDRGQAMGMENPFSGVGFQEIELNALLGQARQDTPDDGDDPEDKGDDDKPDKPKAKIEMKVTVECPECGHKFER